MTRFSAMCALLVIATAFSSAAPARTAGRTYASARYHFTVTVPAGWAIKAATVDAKASRFPEGDHAETESFDGPSNSWTPEIGIAAVELKEGTTLAAWTRTTIGLIGKQFACLSPNRSTTTVGSERAMTLIYSACYAMYFIDVTAVHHGRGYDLFWLSTDTGNPARHPGDRALFDRTLASFHFTD